MVSKKKKVTVGIAMKSALGQNIPVSLEKRKGFVSLFMNAQRRKLFNYLCNYPCSNMRMVSRDMGIGLPSARWHLDHLRGMGFIEYKDIGKFKIFYPSRFISKEFVEAYALMNKEQARTIFKWVLGKGGISHQDLANGAGLSPQNLGGWIKKFEELEMITPVKDGRINRYFPTILVSEMEKMERNQRNGFKRFILNKLHQDGVNPRVSESSGNRYVLDIKVGGESYYLKLSLTPLRTILDGRDSFLREFPLPKRKDDAKEKVGTGNGTGQGTQEREQKRNRDLAEGLDKFRQKTRKQ